MDMNITDWIYTVMITVQVLCWVRIIRKAISCHWDRPSRWITLRMSIVSAGVLLLTLTGWWANGDSDWMLQCAYMVALVSMTMLILLHLPDIVAGMTDPNVAEDLNIRVYLPDEEHKEINHE